MLRATLVVTIMLLCCAMTGAILVQQQHQAAVTRQQGRQITAKLCSSFSKLASLKPPPMASRDSAGQDYDQRLHVILSELGTDIGCLAAGSR
jgi:hypothetical protein